MTTRHIDFDTLPSVDGKTVLPPKSGYSARDAISELMMLMCDLNIYQEDRERLHDLYRQVLKIRIEQLESFLKNADKEHLSAELRECRTLLRFEDAENFKTNQLI